MASRNMPQLSLVAQYDDLCRHTKILTEGCEKEFRQFVEGQKRLYQKRKCAENELKGLRKKVNDLEMDKRKNEAQIEHLKFSVMDELKKRKALEQEKASMERQIALIKDVLLNDGNTMDNKIKERLFQLSSTHKQPSPTRLTTIEESIGSLLSASECDQSSEEMDAGITHRKRSKGKKSLGDSLQKRRKSEERANRLSSDSDFRLDDVNINDMPRKNPMTFFSSSDLNTNRAESLTPRSYHRSDSEQIKDSRKYNTLGYTGSRTPVGRYSSGGQSNRSHSFVTKTIIKSEKCYPCGKNIKFCHQVLKCVNCRVTCHPECRDKCPEYCIYASSTPTKGTGTISDYTSTTPPMIPPLIVHCVKQIESRGLNTVGLYRESGSQVEVRNLTDMFLRGKSIPSLNDADIHAVCGTIKFFLRSLKDTLITKAAWKTFVDAASCSDEAQSINLVFNAVCDLPQPNRDTLAFLILHFQRIAVSPECKMPIQNLAKVFGPTIVGHSSSDPVESNLLPESLAQVRQQYIVMERLLMIPTDSWQNLLNDENDPFYTPMRTPECTPAPVTSRLGPILTSGQKSRNTTPVTRTPLKPRVTRNGSKVQKRQFFSPLLK